MIAKKDHIVSPSFSADCGGPYDLEPEHTITCWEDMPTSPAESVIIDYLTANPALYRGKRLLHVGIGNSALPLALKDLVAAYVGLTISEPELNRFNRTLGTHQNMTGLLINKYDPRGYPRIEGEFEVIVDTLLKSVACCEKHFHEMMRFFARRLRAGGKIITTRNGVHFGWPGNTVRAYTPGAQLDPALGSARVLGLTGLEATGRKYGLTLTDEGARQVGEKSDIILTLTKR